MAPRDKKELPPGWEKELPPGWEGLSRAETLEQKLDFVHQKMLEQFGQFAEEAFDLGDMTILIDVLGFYLANNTLPPKWACDELRKACTADVQSWGDVFGAHPGKRSKRRRMEEKAYREGERLRKQHGYKRSDDSDLFPELGKILSVSAGMAKEYYYGRTNRREKKWDKKRSEMPAVWKMDPARMHKAELIELLHEMNQALCDEVLLRRQILADVLHEMRSGKTPEQLVEEALQTKTKRHTSGKSGPKIRINKH